MKIRIKLTDNTHRDYNIETTSSEVAETRAQDLMDELEREGHNVLEYTIADAAETF